MMGVELEFKLAVPQPELLDAILSDDAVTQLRRGEFHLLNMATTYYDTPELTLRQRRWTLRLRQENDLLVATVKTPAAGRARGEWSCEAETIESAIDALVALGAPEELKALTADKPLFTVCAAKFTRRAADLVFPDGTVCELAGDIGLLMGGSKKAGLCEVELELKEGSEATVQAFAEALMVRYGLREETKSKFARAATLAQQ